jgi:hypothetical protein
MVLDLKSLQLKSQLRWKNLKAHPSEREIQSFIAVLGMSAVDMPAQDPTP